MKRASCSASAALAVTLVARATLAQSEPAPEITPLVINTTPAISLPAARVPTLEELRFAPGSAARIADENNTRFRARTRERILSATLASIGAAAIGGGLSAGGAMVPLVLCWSCAGQTIASGAVFGAMAAATAFLIPAAYQGLANRFDARGSYWATFAGFVGGAAAGALFATPILTIRAISAPVAYTVLATAAVLPFVGQALGYELSARPLLAHETPRAPRAPQWAASVSVDGQGATSLAVAGVF